MGHKLVPVWPWCDAVPVPVWPCWEHWEWDALSWGWPWLCPPYIPYVCPTYPHVSPTDINELNLPKTCEIDFSDQDDLLHFRLLICPDEVGPLPHPTTPNLRSPSSCSPFPPPLLSLWISSFLHPSLIPCAPPTSPSLVTSVSLP